MFCVALYITAFVWYETYGIDRLPWVEHCLLSFRAFIGSDSVDIFLHLKSNWFSTFSLLIFWESFALDIPKHFWHLPHLGALHSRSGMLLKVLCCACNLLSWIGLHLFYSSFRFNHVLAKIILRSMLLWINL